MIEMETSKIVRRCMVRFVENSLNLADLNPTLCLFSGVMIMVMFSQPRK